MTSLSFDNERELTVGVNLTGEKITPEMALARVDEIMKKRRERREEEVRAELREKIAAGVQDAAEAAGLEIAKYEVRRIAARIGAKEFG